MMQLKRRIADNRRKLKKIKQPLISKSSSRLPRKIRRKRRRLLQRRRSRTILPQM
jgi:hypothetical protein